MATSECTFLFFLFACSWASVGHCQGGGGGNSLSCIQKLMPCEPYLKGSSPPPASCCIPLKEIVADDAQCLCEIFSNAALLKSFNVTQDEALGLAKSCGANADTSLCKKGTAPSPSPSTAGATAPSTKGSTASPHKSAANAMCYTCFGGCARVAAAVLCLTIVSMF